MSGLQNGQSPAMANYYWRGFAYELTLKYRADGRGLRSIGAEIGVSASDLSRAMGGQMVSIAKVIAMCAWMETDVMDYYQPPESWPMNTKRCSGSNVKQVVHNPMGDQA